MGNTRPTAKELKKAFKQHGVDMRYYKGWKDKGRAWGSDGGGLYAVVVHHTSTASAKEGAGAPTLYWAVNAYAPYAVANQLVGKDPRSNWCLSAGGTYHSGLGGPWNAVGLRYAGNTLHWRAWGIEIDDPGRSNTINKYQIEQTARTIAALWDLCGWPEDGSRIITHGDWTDSGPYLDEKSYGPHRYRKNDTLRQWYDQDFWRNEARKYRINAPEVPSKPEPSKPTSNNIPEYPGRDKLTQGQKSDDVVKLQKELIRNGFKIPAGATGFYGSQTRRAVKELYLSFDSTNSGRSVTKTAWNKLFKM